MVTPSLFNHIQKGIQDQNLQLVVNPALVAGNCGQHSLERHGLPHSLLPAAGHVRLCCQPADGPAAWQYCSGRTAGRLDR